MKISDEIRDYCKKVLCYTHYYDKFWYFADLIDHEMVELPKDKDGRPIHVGDKVYLDDGHMACATEIDIHDNHVVVDCWDGSKHMACHPSDISRTRHDSWERIADDIEESNGAVFIESTTLSEWAGRIRKLAERDEER